MVIIFSEFKEMIEILNVNLKELIMHKFGAS